MKTIDYESRIKHYTNMLWFGYPIMAFDVVVAAADLIRGHWGFAIFMAACAYVMLTTTMKAERWLWVWRRLRDLHQAVVDATTPEQFEAAFKKWKEIAKQAEEL